MAPYSLTLQSLTQHDVLWACLVPAGAGGSKFKASLGALGDLVSK